MKDQGNVCIEDTVLFKDISYGRTRKTGIHGESHSSLLRGKATEELMMDDGE